MPKRTDIRRILVIGSGPIIIGQACEFDYSGTQGCKALKEEGYEVILVNSNPATIMTDPGFANKIYLEPLLPEFLAQIVARERPQALLPTLGGQTALNLATQLHEKGILQRYGVELIGASYEAIKRGEDRGLFKQAMKEIGYRVANSGLARNIKQATEVARTIGFPVIIRPAYTLGGTGSAIAYNIEEFRQLAEIGLKFSFINEILIEESLCGWKEYELEVMRDLKDNVIIICSIENLDPMGVHTGDSITVAPIQTLTDSQYQDMRDAAIRIIRKVGVATGGANIQFAVNPENGEMVVVETNPRVSRSSALASKATGFPIAKIAAKLAVGYTLDELPNDITKKTPVCFEPAIDYCVVKIPRFNFEKFPGAAPYLTTAMQSVGEVMAIGRTFKEALQKAWRSLEQESEQPDTTHSSQGDTWLKTPNPWRISHIKRAFHDGWSPEQLYQLTRIDRWFLSNIREIVSLEKHLKRLRSQVIPKRTLEKAKAYGLSDREIAGLTGYSEEAVRKLRETYRIQPQYKSVDTCAGEFVAYTPYFYSSYEPSAVTRLK